MVEKKRSTSDGKYKQKAKTHDWAEIRGHWLGFCTIGGAASFDGRQKRALTDRKQKARRKNASDSFRKKAWKFSLLPMQKKLLNKISRIFMFNISFIFSYATEVSPDGNIAV